MKRYKILSAALVAAVLGGASAMAQSFNYQNGDMLAAFGNGGSVDVIVNLGSISQFQSPSPVTAAFSYDLSSVLDSTFGSVNSSIYWSVFGVNDLSQTPSDPTVTQANAKTLWATQSSAISTPHVSGQANNQLLAVGDMETIANLTSPGDAAPGAISNPANGIALVNVSLGGFSAMNNPVNTPYNGNFQGDLSWNSLNYGDSTSVLYQSDPGNPRTQFATPLGGFTLGTVGSSDGVLTFNPVPEPSTWALLASGTLGLLALRRRR